MEGEPNEELIEALRTKLLHKSFKPDFDEYWNVIESTLERNPENPKEVSDAVSALLMFKLTVLKLPSLCRKNWTLSAIQSPRNSKSARSTTSIHAVSVSL